VSDGFQHSTNLSFPSLSKNEADNGPLPPFEDLFDPHSFGLREAILQLDPRAQRRKGRLIRNASDDR
jgi:hypothetical protein